MINDAFKIRYKAAPIAMDEQVGFATTELHNHYEFEIISVKEGKAKVCIGNTDYFAAEGDLIFINPMEVHSVCVDKGENYRHQCICFDLSLVMDKLLSENLKNETSHIMHHIPKDNPHHTSLQKYFDEIVTLFQQEEKTFSMEVSAYITLMFSCLIKHSLIDGRKSNAKESKFCKEVMEYVRKHYGERVSSKQIAERMFLNHSYFCRKFKENFGMGFSNYLNIYRISMARKFLEDGAFNVEQVSELCGFDTPEYFSKCFKKHIGILPGRYQKRKTSS